MMLVEILKKKKNTNTDFIQDSENKNKNTNTVHSTCNSRILKILGNFSNGGPVVAGARVHTRYNLDAVFVTLGEISTRLLMNLLS